MRTVLALALSLSSSLALAQPAKPADKAAPAAAGNKPAEPPGQAKKAEAAAPAAGAKAEMPKPPEELSVEKWFVGKWTCDGNQTESPMGPAGKYTNALDVKMTLQGWWLMFSVDRKKGPPPTGNTVSGASTFDPVAKKHMRVDFMPGGGMVQMTSTGWEGDKLVFSGDMMMGGKKMPVKHTFTKKSDKEWSAAYEVTGPDGKAMPWIEETCKKSGK